MAHFSKRHYEAIAKVMQDCHPGPIPSGSLDSDDCITTCQEQWEDIVRQLARMFINDNHLFQTDRFCHACLPGSNVKAKTAHLKVAS